MPGKKKGLRIALTETPPREGREELKEEINDNTKQLYFLAPGHKSADFAISLFLYKLNSTIGKRIRFLKINGGGHESLDEALYPHRFSWNSFDASLVRTSGKKITRPPALQVGCPKEPVLGHHRVQWNLRGLRT